MGHENVREVMYSNIPCHLRQVAMIVAESVRDGFSFGPISVPWVAFKCNMTKRNVRKHLAALVDMGYMHRCHTVAATRGGRIWVYELTLSEGFLEGDGPREPPPPIDYRSFYEGIVRSRPPVPRGRPGETPPVPEGRPEPEPPVPEGRQPPVPEGRPIKNPEEYPEEEPPEGDDDDVVAPGQADLLTGRVSNGSTPYARIAALYHEHTTLPRAKVLTKKRRALIRARWKEHPDLDWWVRYFRLAEAHSFLHGDNDRDWEANLDFLLNENKMTTLREGGYYKKSKDQIPDDLVMGGED